MQPGGRVLAADATRTAVRIDAILDAPFDRKQHRALAEAAQEYAEFVGLEAELNPQVA